MSFQLVITLDPQAQAVLAQAQAWPVSLLRGMARAHDLQNELTVGAAKLKRMSRRGPTTLGVVTNRLRSSLTRSNATITGTSVTSTIGTNVAYAAVHEFGFDGTVQVKSFSRRDPNADRYKLGKTVILHKDARALHILSSTGKQKLKRVAEGFVTVRAHSRHMKMPARSFIRATLEERRSDYARALSAEIVASFRGGAA